jgi:hypothetical protein
VSIVSLEFSRYSLGIHSLVDHLLPRTVYPSLTLVFTFLEISCAVVV